LKALTVIHNYMVKRADGTTAAERFFGQKHRDVFTWLVHDRRKKAAMGASIFPRLPIRRLLLAFIRFSVPGL
jgi:hypothetical protein